MGLWLQSLGLGRGLLPANLDDVRQTECCIAQPDYYSLVAAGGVK